MSGGDADRLEVGADDVAPLPADLDPVALLDVGAVVAGGPAGGDLFGAHGLPVGELVALLCLVARIIKKEIFGYRSKVRSGEHAMVDQ